MTEPILTATKRPITEAVAAHPLATQTGLSLMLHLIEADRVWSGCTKPQRALLSEVCPPLAERLVREGQLTAADMPMMWSQCGIATLRAMQRRRLVDEEGRLTASAVHAWYYAVDFPKRGDT